MNNQLFAMRRSLRRCIKLPWYYELCLVCLLLKVLFCLSDGILPFKSSQVDCVTELQSHTAPITLQSRTNKATVVAVRPEREISHSLQELLKHRNRVVNERCEILVKNINPETGKFQPDEIFQFSDLQLKWCPVYKGGSTNIIRTLCPKYYSQETCKRGPISAELLRDDPNGRFIENRNLPLPSLLIVREPFQRIVSCYLDKIINMRKPSFQPEYMEMLSLYRPILAEVVPFKKVLLWSAVYEPNVEDTIRMHYGVKNPYLSGPSFSEFISYIISGHVNPHWMPIFSACQPCFYQFDYILKLENFDKEFPTFLQEQNVNISYKLSPKKTASSRSKVTELFSELSDSQLTGFYQLFQADCEMFGYDCERTLEQIRERKHR